MTFHTIVEMGFVPLVRQRAFSQRQWVEMLNRIFVPKPAVAVIYEDDSDLESDAGWYPDERDVEQGLF